MRLCIFVSVVRNRLVYSALNLFFSEKISTILSLLCLLTRVGRFTGILLVDHVFQISFTFSASTGLSIPDTHCHKHIIFVLKLTLVVEI